MLSRLADIVGSFPPASEVLRPGLFWVAVLWVAGAVVLITLGILAAGLSQFPGDVAATRAFQQVDVPVLGGFLSAVNQLGNPQIFLGIPIGLSAAFLLFSAKREASLLLLTYGAGALNAILKQLVGRSRPSVDVIDNIQVVSGSSFPSGHTVAITVLFGLLFLLIPRLTSRKTVQWVTRAGCLLMIAAAGPARVYIGVHWTSDVIGGYLLAFLLLVPVAVLYLGGGSRRSSSDCKHRRHVTNHLPDHR